MTTESISERAERIAREQNIGEAQALRVAHTERRLEARIAAEPYFRGDGPLAVAERQIADERRREAERADHPRPPAYWRDLSTATHRIRGGRAVCDGDRGSQCHCYPNCDEHESWPCGCEYVQHDECWAIAWLDAVDLEDTAYDEALDRRDPETLEWPDGEIEYEWDGDNVLWNYAPEPEDPTSVPLDTEGQPA